MTLFRFTFLSLLATGCFGGDTTDTGDSSAPDCDETDPESDCYEEPTPDCEDVSDECDDNCDEDEDPDCAETEDTGTAYLINIGSLQYNRGADSLSLQFGFGTKNLATEEVVCALQAEYSSTGAGADGCPECDYSFATEVTGGGSEGTYCDTLAMSSDATMAADYTDFWMGNGDINGWGWAEAYTYTYAGTDYDLTQSIFLHYEANGYSEWYLRAYNFPDAGIYAVTGDMNSASWESYVGGEPTYYYYFYY